jgi:3-isopropylmalate/(R)-2-methylmalate dehydratase small subunit
VQPFSTLKAIAAPIDEPNVDTNQLCPTKFSKTPRGPGHASILFNFQRFRADGSKTDFILNREPFNHAQIIVGERNWGCGSGREGAVYALYEFGIRCVIAPSFAETHAANCARNGILTVVLPSADLIAIRQQLHDCPDARMTVDLDAQTVIDPSGKVHSFDIHPVRKKCLILGLDDFGRTDEYAAHFEKYIQAYRERRRWLFRST